MLLGIIGAIAAIATLTISFTIFSAVGDDKKRNEHSLSNPMQPIPVEKKDHIMNDEICVLSNRGKTRDHNCRR